MVSPGIREAFQLTNLPKRQYEDEIDLLRYGRFLASYWWLLMLCTFGGVIATLGIRSQQPMRYQATATLAINANASTAPALTPATARALIANLSTVAETITELQLNRYGMTSQSFVEHALQVQAVPATNLLRVSVALSDPTKARLAAEAVSVKAVELSRQLDQEGAVTLRDALKKQMDDAALRLDAAEARLLEYQSAMHIELLEQGTEARMRDRDSLERLGLEIQAENARRSSMEEELTRQPKVLIAPRSSSDPAPRSEIGPSVDAGNVYGASPFANPVYSLLQYEIAQSRARVSSLEQKVRGLRGRLGPSETKTLNTLYQRRIELSRRQADADVSKRVYDDLARRYEEARGRVVGFMPQLQLVDAPVQPDRPLSRRFLQYGILGGLAGLIVGCVTAVLLERRRSLRAVA